MIVLITGGGGMIGQAIAKRHLAAGDQVFIYDTFVNSYRDYENLAGILINNRGNSYSSTERSQDLLRSFFRKLKPDILSIQGSLVSVGESQARPQHYLNNNIGHVSMLIQLMQEVYLPKRIMLAGSMGPYGEGRRECLKCGLIQVYSGHRKVMIPTCSRCQSSTKALPMREDQTLLPLNQYAVSKRSQEDVLRVFALTTNIPTVSLRYFSVYGDDAPPQNPHTGVLSIIGNKILNHSEVELNEDGDQTRDLVHCDDCANAHFHFCHLTMEEPFLALNIGTGVRSSLHKIAGAMLQQMGSSKRLMFNHRIRPGDARDCESDTKLGETLGWRATINLENKIPLYCNWLLENREKFTL